MLPGLVIPRLCLGVLREQGRQQSQPADVQAADRERVRVRHRQEAQYLACEPAAVVIGMLGGLALQPVAQQAKLIAGGRRAGDRVADTRGGQQPIDALPDGAEGACIATRQPGALLRAAVLARRWRILAPEPRRPCPGGVGGGLWLGHGGILIASGSRNNAGAVALVASRQSRTSTGELGVRRIARWRRGALGLSPTIARLGGGMLLSNHRMGRAATVGWRWPMARCMKGGATARSGVGDVARAETKKGRGARLSPN